MPLFDNDDLEFEKKIREDDKITPLTAPGQDKIDGLFSVFDDDDDDLPITPSNPFAKPTADLFSRPQPSLNPGTSPYSFGAPVEPKKEIEDIIFDQAKVGVKGSVNIMKTLILIYKASTHKTKSQFGGYLVSFGGVTSLLFLICTFFDSSFFPLILGGLFQVCLGFIFLAFNYDKAKSETVTPSQPIQEPSEEIEVFDLFEEESENDFDTEVDVEIDNEFDITDDILGEMLSSIDTIESPDDVLDSIETDKYGLVSSSNIIEKVTPILDSIHPHFAKTTELLDTSTEFLTYAVQIKQLSNRVLSSSGVELNLNKAVVGFATDMLYIDRPRDDKTTTVKRFDSEFTKVLAYTEGNIFNPAIKTNTVAVANNWITQVTKEPKGMVSLRDALALERDFMTSASNILPILLGYSPDGTVIKTDLRDVESMLISGVARAGKTWFVNLILGQLVLFHSPEEVILYIIDSKGAGSDYYQLKTPHVKAFVSEPQDILTMLNHLVTTEFAIRSEKLHSAKATNIWEYNKANPQDPMPVLYVVIDEMVALNNSFDKDGRVQYRQYLETIVTKLPYVGVRLIGIPHVLKDQVISKTLIDTVSFKATVGGDSSHIDAVAGESTNFPYKLVNKGDIAMRGSIYKGNLPTPDLEFCKAFVLAKDKDSMDRVFDLAKNIWIKLSPDAVKGSRAEE